MPLKSTLSPFTYAGSPAYGCLNGTQVDGDAVGVALGEGVGVGVGVVVGVGVGVGSAQVVTVQYCGAARGDHQFGEKVET